MDWRRTGPVPYALWRDTITAAGGPADLAAPGCHAAAGDLSGLCLAMLGEESSYATDFDANKPENRNPLNLRPRGGDGYLRFARYEDGIAEWRARLLDPAYAYAPTRTLEELVHTYAPSSDSNNEQAYVAGIRSKFARWGVKEAPVVVTPATIDYSRLPVPVIVDLIPESQPNQNPGIPNDPDKGTWHETANEAAGADALMHARYLANGADGSQISWHFTVDDERIVQHLPLNRVGWHAGDGGGPGNRTIGVECCVNRDGDLRKAQRNTAALFGLLIAEGIIDDVEQHNRWSGKHCPRFLREGRGGYAWPQAKAEIDGFRQRFAAPAAPQPYAIWWKRGEVGVRTNADGTKALAMLASVRTKRKAKLRQSASAKGRVLKEVKEGTELLLLGTYIADNRQRWAFVADPDEPEKVYRTPMVHLTPSYPTL
jgi:N-acetylmuramoyl-L-alanine amidase CwlA